MTTSYTRPKTSTQKHAQQLNATPHNVVVSQLHMLVHNYQCMVNESTVKTHLPYLNLLYRLFDSVYTSRERNCSSISKLHSMYYIMPQWLLTIAARKHDVIST